MSSWNKAFAVAMGLALAPVAHAGPVEDLRQFVGNSQSARGEFSQRIERKSGARDVVSSGQFSFQRPGKFRWEVLKPSSQLLLGDGDKVYFYDKDLNQVTARKASDALGSTPAGILFGGGLSALDENFTVADAGTKDGKAWLEAIPKNKDAGFEKLRISMQKGVPEIIEVLDVLGQRTTITLKDVMIGAKADAAQYRFTLPPGADLIQQ
jgi:outer membrane lipoprotein carrier protein